MSDYQEKQVSDGELLQELEQGAASVREELSRIIVGHERMLQDLMLVLLASGHALIVGVPGLAKTLTVSSFAQCLELSFGRVQFTPDLLPADITGTDVLSDPGADQMGGRVTEFIPGPIFHQVVLADEINRTPPKTQAALLQAMQEREVSVGGRTHHLPEPFIVLATRNPIEQEGTYPLPEAQLDRFLLEIPVEYPTLDEELEIARRTTGEHPASLKPVLNQEQI
ncbi:MAG: AAA family ATPase, partial [Polyangiaceae bacterium]|nr:AAA family ATPase [Polyangiaceae bacterium]